MAFCNWCSDEFFPNVGRKQIYCSPECRKLASKSKIVQRYVLEKRKKRIGKEKRCAGGCGTILSIYNDSALCDVCLINNKKFNSFMKDLRDYFDYEA